jgi:ankyrin repeat protein
MALEPPTNTLSRFHKVVFYHQWDVVESLVRCGVDVDHPQGPCGNTALHVVYGEDATQRLIGLGADPTIQNANGDVPLTIALKAGDWGAAHVLANFAGKELCTDFVIQNLHSRLLESMNVFVYKIQDWYDTEDTEYKRSMKVIEFLRGRMEVPDSEATH